MQLNKVWRTWNVIFFPADELEKKIAGFGGSSQTTQMFKIVNKQANNNANNYAQVMINSI